MSLTEFDIVNGISCLTIVIIYAIIAITFLLKYYKTKERIYLLFGLSWGLMVEAWYSNAISFLIILITGGAGIPFIWYAIIGITLYPFALLIWLTAFTDFVLKEKQKIILLVFGIIGALFETFFFYFLFTDSSVIGTPYGAVDAHYGLLVSGYLALLVVVFLITGLFFAHLSLKSKEPEIRLRGKLIFIAIVLFGVGAFLDILPNFSIPILIIGRLLLILSAIMFYCAFILSKSLKKLFLK